MNKERKLILTCALCANFEPNRSICKLNGEARNPITSEFAPNCRKEGNFIRDLNVIPDAFNYYREDEDIPYDYQMDLSKLPTDEAGIPLFVNTKRGIERAIPANDSVKMKSHRAFGVESIYTYQGQRELIYDLGIEQAQKEANAAGIKLTITPEELQSENKRETSKKNEKECYWLKSDPLERWD